MSGHNRNYEAMDDQPRGIGALFLLFNLILFSCVGGVLFYLRIHTDPLDPLPLTTLNVGIIVVAWALSVLGFFAFAGRAHAMGHLTGLTAIMSFIVFIELFGMGWTTYRRFTKKPVGVLKGRLEVFTGAVEDLKKKPPMPVEENIQLTRVDMLRGALTYYYDVKDGAELDEAKLKKQNTEAACTNLAYHFTHRMIFTANYVYRMKDRKELVIPVRWHECNLPKDQEFPPSLWKGSK
jgi:hypothetical protein